MFGHGQGFLSLPAAGLTHLSYHVHYSTNYSPPRQLSSYVLCMEEVDRLHGYHNVGPSFLMLAKSQAMYVGKQFPGSRVENCLGIVTFASGLGGVGGAVPLWGKGVQI